MWDRTHDTELHPVQPLHHSTMTYAILTNDPKIAILFEILCYNLLSIVMKKYKFYLISTEYFYNYLFIFFYQIIY